MKSNSILQSSEWSVPESVQRGLFLLALLLVALASVAFGLAGVVRDMDARLLLMVAGIGALVGWVLATSRLPDWLVRVMACVFGFTLVFVRVGRLDGDLMAMLRGIFSLYLDVWRWILRGSSLDWSPLLQALVELRTGAAILLVRWADWLWALLSGEPAFDPVATAMVWSLAAWAVAAWAGYKVRRHQPLPALVPAITLLVATLQYVRAKPFSLLPPLGVALLLMALARHDAREHRWRAAKIQFSRDIWGDLAVKAALLSLALIITATLVSSISLSKLIEFGRQFGEEQTNEGGAIAESLGVAQRPAQVQKSGLESARAGGLPRRHLLNSGPELSDRVVMFISVSDPPSELPPRYYWRSVNYDYYNGRGWFSDRTTMELYDAGQSVMTATLGSHRLVRQQVEIVGDFLDSGQVEGDLVHAAGTLFAADRDYSVAWREPADAFGAIIESRDTGVYRIDSLIPVVSEEQLRDAGSNYPDWMRARYLALPDRIPPQLLSLARDLTATEPTPYDRAHAIEAYLRTFPYTLDVSAPPYDRDVAAYFLFDVQEGYCDYFASSMVVLARAAGLPARMVIGYVGDEYDAERARYIVTADKAHAWPEIYFPGYGWIEFEPTSGYPSIERPVETVPFEWVEPEGELEPAATGWDVANWPWGQGLLGGLVLLALGVAGWAAVDGYQLRYQKPAVVVAMLYGRLWRYGRRLAVPLQAGDTPYEFSTSLAEWMTDRVQDNHRGEMTLSAIQDVRWLIDLYVQTSYSLRSPDDSDRARAVQVWWMLRWWFWRFRRRAVFKRRVGQE